MKSSRHEEALDRQVDLIQWWKSNAGTQYAAKFMRYSLEGRVNEPLDDDDYRRGMVLAESQAHALDRAPTYWVSPDMITLVEHAQHNMPGQPLRADDLPTQSGFVLFDRSVQIVDARGKRVGFKAVLWCPAIVRIAGHPSDAINVIFYSDRDVADEDDVSYEYIKAHREGLPKLILLHLTPWGFDRPWGDDDRLVDKSVLDVRRFMAAFWTIIQQHIIADARPSRPVLRRAARRGKVTPINEIKVVTLRKVIRRAADDAEEHEAEHVDWSHRWIVDGHWRNQYYPSIEGHRLIWISPYVKGPEDRPLINKDKIYKVSR